MFYRLVVFSKLKNGSNKIGIFNYSERPSFAHADHVQSLVMVGFLALVLTMAWVMYMQSGGSADKKTIVKSLKKKSNEEELIGGDEENGSGNEIEA